MIKFSSVGRAIHRTNAKVARLGRSLGRNTSQLARTLVAEARRGLGKPAGRPAVSRAPDINRSTSTPLPRAAGEQTRSGPTVRFAPVTVNGPQTQTASKQPMLSDVATESPRQNPAPVPMRRVPAEADKALAALLANLETQYPAFAPTAAPVPADLAETDKAYAELLADLEIESQKASLTSAPKVSTPVENQKALASPSVTICEEPASVAFAEVDRLIDQLEARRLAEPTSPMARQQAARQALDDTTAELTALMDGLKRDISASRGQGVASASEMLPAEKVRFSAQSVSAQAVTEELDGEPIKQIPIRRPHPMLMAEATPVKLAD